MKKDKRHVTIYLADQENLGPVVNAVEERHKEIFGTLAKFSFSKYVQYLMLRDFIQHGLFEGDEDSPFEATPNEALLE